MHRESYFLDMGLIGILRNIDFMNVITSKDTYEYIKNEYQNNLLWRDEHLFTLKTFYKWIRQGKKDFLNSTISKESLLYQEVHRLKNSLRQENQEKLSLEKLNVLNQTSIIRLVYLGHKKNWQLEKSKQKIRKNQNITS
ncbi:MAG: hypothetical protein ACRC0X_04315 [Brevinema sp.]